MSMKTLRESKHIRVSTVAKTLKVSHQAVYRYENGQRKFPPELLPDIAQLYDEPLEVVYHAAYGNREGRKQHEEDRQKAAP